MISGTAPQLAAVAMARMSGVLARIQEAQSVASKAIATISFMVEHNLSDEEFITDHWQTLFRIEYPDARS